MTSETVLVAGATGQQGHAVARGLLREGWEVRALTRDPSAAASRALAAAGAEVYAGDLDDPDSLTAAARGVYGVFSVHPGSYDGSPDGYDPAHEIRAARNLADVAVAAGAGHVVHSSATGIDNPDLRAVLPMLTTKAEAEQRVRERFGHATVLRPTSFMENYLGTMRGLSNGALATGLLPDTHEPLIAVDDIGAFAALAFADPSAHGGRVYELAGDVLTQVDIAAVISRETGQHVPYVNVPIDEIRTLSADTALALDTLNTMDNHVDIAALRAIHPDLMTFPRWAAANSSRLTAALA